MTISHNPRSGVTRITLSWTESRQAASGAGLDVLRNGIRGALKHATSVELPVPSETEEVPEVFTVYLDGEDFYQGGDRVTAVMIHGLLTGVLYKKKLSGVVHMHGTLHSEALLYEAWVDGKPAFTRTNENLSSVD